jgi:hypothetical protein
MRWVGLVAWSRGVRLWISSSDGVGPLRALASESLPSEAKRLETGVVGCSLND